MKKSVFRVAAAAAVAGLFATMAPLSALAATEPTTFPSTSDAPIYLTNGNDYTQYPAGTQLDWNQQEGVILSSIPTPTAPTDYDPLRFPAPTGGALTAKTFISAQGDEKTQANWKGWGDSVALNGQGIWLPQVTPNYQSGPGLAGVKSAGGTYSLGVAYLKNNDLTVVSAYFTTINVDPGVGTWKFATHVAPTTVPTTTNLTADKASLTVGGSVTLTATVTPSAAAGSVEFFDGATSLGTSVVSTGTATRTATVSSVGSHSYKAVYSPSSSSYGASTSPVVTVTGIAKKVFTQANKPTISGKAKVGKKLTAKVKAWSPVATYAYQWYANGTAITGATRSTWKLVKAQKGKKITVKVTGSRADYASVSLTSKATAKVKK